MSINECGWWINFSLQIQLFVRQFQLYSLTTRRIISGSVSRTSHSNGKTSSIICNSIAVRIIGNNNHSIKLIPLIEIHLRFVQFVKSPFQTLKDIDNYFDVVLVLLENSFDFWQDLPPYRQVIHVLVHINHCDQRGVLEYGSQLRGTWDYY